MQAGTGNIRSSQGDVGEPGNSPVVAVCASPHE